MSEYSKKIFPITYYHCNIKNNNHLKDLLVHKIMNTYDDLLDPNWFTNKVKTSFNTPEKNKEVFSKENDIIHEEYSTCLSKFFDKPYKISISDFWYNCYIDGEYQEEHNHLGNIFNPNTFSCVHFLSFDPTRHKPLVFYDPMEKIRSNSLEFDSNNYSQLISLDIKEGDFVMFPSYLNHSVEASPKTEDYPRITISFNLRVSAYGDDSLAYY
jgi:hypothetical protein